MKTMFYLQSFARCSALLITLAAATCSALGADPPKPAPKPSFALKVGNFLFRMIDRTAHEAQPSARPVVQARAQVQPRFNESADTDQPVVVQSSYSPGAGVSKTSNSQQRVPQPGIAAQDPASINPSVVPASLTSALKPVAPPPVPLAAYLGTGWVKSPFPPYNTLDVAGISSGSLAKDPSTGRIFRVP